MDKIVQKVWGSEAWIANNELYCGKILSVKKDCRCSIHHHKLKDETFYVLSGEIKLELFGKTIMMKEGDSYRLLPNTLHRFTGIEDSKIIEFSTHHDDSDSYRIKKGGRIE